MERFVIYVIVGIIILYFFKKLFNTGGIIGAIIGGILGVGTGISGGGGASNGLLIFAGLGFIIGGLISNSLSNKNKLKKITRNNSNKPQW